METVGLKRLAIYTGINPLSVLIFLLLFGAMISVGSVVNEVIQGPEMWGSQLTLIAFALALGWLLAHKRILFWLTLTLGGPVINLIIVGQLGGKVLSAIGTSPRILWEVFNAQIGEVSSFRRLIETMTDITSDLGVMLGRLWAWFSGFISADPIPDPAVIAVLLGFGFWFISMWAGWVVNGRGNALLAIIPAGVLLSVAVSYAWVVTNHVFVFLGTSLLLTALLQQQGNQARWQKEGIDRPGDISIEVGIAAIAITLALLLFGAISPHITYRQVVDLFRGGEDPASSAPSIIGDVGSGGIDSRFIRGIFDSHRAPGLPRQHLIGSGPELSEEEVMSVRLLNPPAHPLDQSQPSYYWRSLTYDVYTGRGWVTSATNILSYQANQEIPPENVNYGYNLEQEVQMLGESVGLIYVSGDLLSVDADFSIAWRGNSDIFAATGGDSNYMATSRLTAVDETKLRQAGSDYPEWVKTHYLEPVSKTSARVSDLALRLTATEPTPYDRALAIESYLRQFPYTLDVSAPPLGHDVVEYFLFDLQQGYCDYYATSMVVLARAAGVPARLAIGYASGTYSEEQEAFVVTEAEAHSWVEIYFPRIGWVVFEPTAGRASIERDALAVSGLDRVDQPASEEQLDSINPFWLVGIIALVLGLGILLRFVIQAQRMRRETTAMVLIDIYHRVRAFSERYPIPLHPGDTPFEFSTRLANFLQSFGDNKPAGTWLVSAMEDVRKITQFVVEEKFSLRSLGTGVRGEAIKTWRNLYPKLVLAWLWHWLRDRG